MGKAWYRKYRPVKFAEILGQENTVKILQNALKHNTFVHAYLFSGPKGTGKTSMAKILAWTINCEQRENGETCSKCKFCQVLMTERTLDILEIDGASNNGVEEIRNMQKNVNLLPVNLKYKIYIIDEIHMLTTAAFNALLKTLEEPPSHVIFIFATTEPYKLPATIISRCQWFTFEKLNIENMVNCFQKILTQEKIQYEVDALVEIAKISEGSLRDGINNLEKVKNYNLIINITSVTKLFNKISSKLKHQFFIALFTKDIANIYQAIDNFMVYESDFKKITVDLIMVLEDVIIQRLTNKVALLKTITVSELEYYQTFSSGALKVVFNNFVDLLCISIDNKNYKLLFSANILKLIAQLKDDNFVLEPIKLLKKPYSNGDENILKQQKITKVAISSEPKTSTIKNMKADNKEEVQALAMATPSQPTVVSIITPTLLSAIINVLVQADKKIRKQIKNEWDKIAELVSNNKFRNYSKIFLNTKITAACENAVIIVCDNITQANFINHQYLNQEYRNFLDFVLKKTYMVYALDKKQWKVVAEKFQDLSCKNELPVPTKITIPPVKIEAKKTTTNRTLAFLQEFFPEVEEI